MSTAPLFLSFPALMAFAASYDCLSMRISNGLCLIVAAAFFPAALAAGLSAADIALHASCALAMLAAGFVLFARGWIGGGDVKLFAAAALWFGWADIAAFALTVSIAGGVLALALTAMQGLRLRFCFPAWLAAFPGRELPYGLALAAGALLVYPHSAWAALLLI